MPKLNYNSITIHVDIYNALKADYEKNKQQLMKEGLTSFTSYCVRKLMRDM